MQRNSVLYLQARQQREAKTVQRLNMSVVDTRTITKPIDSQSIRGLAEQLRDATLPTAVETQIDVTPLKATAGYYFIATDRQYGKGKAEDYRQLVEGVLLRSGYLINFTLLTNDATSADARGILSALDDLRIE